MSETFEDRDRTPHSRIGGIQRLWRFENGYGASVVQNVISYGYEQGLWELAVLRYSGPGEIDSYLDYSTPITDDVIGHLTEDGIAVLIEKIRNLENPDE